MHILKAICLIFFVTLSVTMPLAAQSKTSYVNHAAMTEHGSSMMDHAMMAAGTLNDCCENADTCMMADCLMAHHTSSLYTVPQAIVSIADATHANILMPAKLKGVVDNILKHPTPPPKA